MKLPTLTGNPSGPWDPTSPRGPGPPGGPTGPLSPGNPLSPLPPADPDKPGGPGRPGSPSFPAVPGLPGDPGTPWNRATDYNSKINSLYLCKGAYLTANKWCHNIGSHMHVIWQSRRLGLIITFHIYFCIVCVSMMQEKEWCWWHVSHIR